MDTLIGNASSSLSAIGLAPSGVIEFMKDLALQAVGVSLLVLQETWIYLLALVVLGAVVGYAKGFTSFGRPTR